MVLNSNTLKETAYAFIKEKILNCEYYPGQNISEKQIAEEIETGRTPVHEALMMLQKEKLVQIYPRKGTCAKEITVKDAIELYQIRKLIEPTAIVNYKRNIDYSKLLDFNTRFVEVCKKTGPLSDKEFYALDIEFHQYLINSTNNERLIQIFHEIMQDTYRLGIFSTLFHNNSTKDETFTQHNEIIRAILIEDDEKIQNACVNHINSSLLSSMNTINAADSAGK